MPQGVFVCVGTNVQEITTCTSKTVARYWRGKSIEMNREKHGKIIAPCGN